MINKIGKNFFSGLDKIDDFKKAVQYAVHHQQFNRSSNEPLDFSRINYIAILILEKIGLNSPSQEQIDIVELLIALAFTSENLVNNLKNTI